ncbi:FeoA family protein [Clostridium sp.]|uniref:FeoA family protein n=1 Tax=Clostridium sp. TaxID=1506 RepID=UPI00261B107F|nr:FeoA family protein [Clostridium sp.]
METLETKKIGEKLVVKGLEKDSSVKRRLLDMGITPGITLEITGKAPLGDPIEVMVRGYKLTLRKTEAKSIFV